MEVAPTPSLFTSELPSRTTVHLLGTAFHSPQQVTWTDSPDPTVGTEGGGRSSMVRT